MPKLYACCTDPNCKTYQSMLLTLSLWLPKPVPQREGKRSYFDASMPEGWSVKRINRFRDLCRTWPQGH